jgi:Zn-dependent peptidase ImmA (M78 family)/DNA-binding XRE family transcriptional regulator
MYPSCEGDGPTQTFTPARLTLARGRRGLNKSALAARVGLTPKSIGDFESDRMTPSAETLQRIAQALKFPVEFFYQAEPDLPSQDAVSFRALASLTASQRDAALGACTIALELSCWIESRFQLLKPTIPDLRNEPPEVAAETIRAEWGLGVRPIHNMVHLLELHGVRVFSLNEQCRELDAFALWHGTRPYCFFNTQKSVEHGRFDAAHELGHLVLHRHGPPQGREAEHQANEFASAFLMPRSTVVAKIQRGASLPQLVAAKHVWGVSAAALAYRSHKVGILSDWHYRNLCIEMSKLRYRTNEPDPIRDRETSQVLHKVFTKLAQDGISRRVVAQSLKLDVNDLESIIFGLVALDGGGEPTGSAPKTPRMRLVR